jgi:hypothetical protein
LAHGIRVTEPLTLGPISIPADGYEWQPVKTWQLAIWLIIYALLMWTYRPLGVKVLDAAYLVTHESGHLLFSYLGSEFLTVAGGTIMQIVVPFLLALSFAWRGHTLGTAFCGWGVFNSLPGVAIYMKDARARAIPLVSPGVASGEVEGHDWNYLFSHLGLLQHDITIGNITMAIAWIGMFTCVAWLIWMWRQTPAD